MTAIFLSLSRVLPATYPVGDDVRRFVDDEHSFGHLLDVGVIQPRIERLYALVGRRTGDPRPCATWSPATSRSYAWDRPTTIRTATCGGRDPSRTARLARAVVR